MADDFGNLDESEQATVHAWQVFVTLSGPKPPTDPLSRLQGWQSSPGEVPSPNMVRQEARNAMVRKLRRWLMLCRALGRPEMANKILARLTKLSRPPNRSRGHGGQVGVMKRRAA